MIISEATEYIKYYEMPIGELIEQACEITENHFGNGFEFCSLISAKTGKCCENCKYCAQSSHYRTDIYTHPLVSLEEVKKAALSARDSGATRFAIVTSGKTPSFEKNFSELLKMIELIENIEGLTSCASLGIINEQEAQMLKNAGLKRYHHNINTSKSYYDFICSTHSYQDRIDTVKLSQKHGLEVCCGAILGMGETREQRIEIALEIRDLKVESAPLNFLDPIAGTPLENYYDKINPEILRTIAIYRIIMPNVGLRYAGGRLKRLSKEYQELGIKAGINSALIGNMLTTIGVTPEDDLDMISKSGKSLIK